MISSPGSAALPGVEAMGGKNLAEQPKNDLSLRRVAHTVVVPQGDFLRSQSPEVPKMPKSSNPMPSPAWRRWPRRAGCGGDPLRIRPGSVERQHPLIRVGGDAHIAPGPDGQDWWDDTYQPPALAPDLPGGCGHPPLRGWGVLPRNLARPILSGVPSTPAACGRHPLQAGEGRSCSYWAAIKTTGFPIILARFFGKAGSPSSVPGCARSTFPVGEGFLRRGMRGGKDFVLHAAPHPSELSPCHPLPEEGLCVFEGEKP